MSIRSSQAEPGALSGLRVLDLSRFISGPDCAMQLGDMGADVVKVEGEKGEDARHFLPQHGGDSLYSMVFNRNKRSVTLRLRDPEDQKRLRQLAARADILIENFVPGTMEKMGCDWETLHALNPRLIFTRISGFGQTGPYAGRPCFDAIAQAMSGMMAVTGKPDGEPTMVGSFVVDYSTALYATIGTLAAIEARHRTGKGQMVDTALLDTAVSFLTTGIPDQALSGRTMGRNGNRDRFVAPGNTFCTGDGDWVHLVVIEARFPGFAAAIDRPGLLSDPRFSTNTARLANAGALEDVIAAWAASLPTGKVLRALEIAAVPHAKVGTIADVVSDPHLRARGSLIDLTHPAGPVTVSGFVARLSDTPSSLRRPVPNVGEHNEEVFAEWLG